MPCRCDDGPSFDETPRLKNQIDRLEEMLCSTCRVLEEQKFDFDKNPQLSKWWDKHKKEDEKRLAKEARAKLRRDLAKALLKKPLEELTNEDRKLLREEGFL